MGVRRQGERRGMVSCQDLDPLRVDAGPEPPADRGVSKNMPAKRLQTGGLARRVEYPGRRFSGRWAVPSPVANTKSRSSFQRDPILCSRSAWVRPGLIGTSRRP